MATSLAKEGRQLAKNVLFYQSIIAIVLAFIITILYGKYTGLSALYGALICLIPAAVFAVLVFKYAGARQNKLVVRSFNKGSKLKFVFTIVLFLFVYKWQNLEPLALLIGYVVTLMAQWPVIIFLSRVNQK